MNLPTNFPGLDADRDVWGQMAEARYQRDRLAGALRLLVASLRPLPVMTDGAAYCRVLDARTAAERALASLDGPPEPTPPIGAAIPDLVEIEAEPLSWPEPGAA